MAPFTIFEDDSATLPNQTSPARTPPSIGTDSAAYFIRLAFNTDTPPQTPSDETKAANKPKKPACLESLPHSKSTLMMLLLVRTLLTVHAQDVYTLVMKHVLPTYTDFDASHPSDEPIPITSMRAYFLHIRSWLSVGSKMRAAARQACAELNNIGASISSHAPADVSAAQILGMDLLTTAMYDVRLNALFQPVVLMAMMSSAFNTKYLYLLIETYRTADGKLSSKEWDDDRELAEFETNHPGAFDKAFARIKTVDIDVLTEPDVSRVAPVVGQFLCEAWMGKTKRDDGDIVKLLKRVLRSNKCRVTVSAALDSRTFSDDPFC